MSKITNFHRRILARAILAVVSAVCVLSLSFPSQAWAREPQEALSARVKEAVYLTVRLDDLSGMLKNIFSPANIETFSSLISPEEAQGIRLVANMISQLPVKSVALVAGTGANKEPFLQLAASMPNELQPKLDLVAAGKAATEDLVTLLLGEGGLLLAAAVPPLAVQNDAAGPYYLIENQVALSAKDDLLLISLSSADLQASFGALEKPEGRLDIERRFESPNYYSLHLDMPTVAALSDEISKDADLKSVLKMFKAPLEIEMGFDSMPESFLVSCGVNVFEALAESERFKDLKPSSGANLFLAGDGKLLYGFSGVSSFNAEDLKVSSEAVKVWEKVSKEMAKRGISEEDLENLLTGSFSLVGGSNATVLGKSVAGVYVALTGQKGAASKFLSKILEDENFTKAVPMSPVKIEGWDTLLMVDPALFPATLLMGVTGETFFFGIVDPKGMGKKPEFSADAAKLFEQKLFAAGFVDTASIWDYLRRKIDDNTSLLGTGFALLPPALADMFRNILGAELAVRSVKLWAPAVETSFTEFSLSDVPDEKRLLPRLLEAAALFEGDEESPLEILLTSKGAIEAQIVQNPDVELDDQKEDFADVTFLETADGDLYIGLQVAGDEKLELIEQSVKFGLTGSAGLGIAPDGKVYDGQEVVWVKITR